jgi:uncharacterized damage-inducible protein DinB
VNADGFRAFYDYHFRLNRVIWSYAIVPLTEAQFLEPSDYSFGSVHNQVVHMLNVDNAWFSDLRGASLVEDLEPDSQHSREKIRALWDELERKMREYLATLTDDMLDKVLLEADPYPLWQVLLHVVNHGTDHRAQLLAQLHRVGGKTLPQDYVFYLNGQL